MEVKTEAVVLQSNDYKDNDKLLTLFSPSLGKITAGIRGVKKPKARLGFSAQPFCFAEYVLAEKGGRYTVTGAYLHESFFELRADIIRFYAGCAAAEICRVLAVENDRHDAMFVAFIECLKALCLAGENEAEAVISFALIALRESGYPIDLSLLESCDGDIGSQLRFDFADGSFAASYEIDRGKKASVSTYHVLRKCSGLEYDETALTGGRKRALRLIKVFLTEKTETRFDSLGEFIRLYEEMDNG